MQLIVALIGLILFSAIAFWRPITPLFMFISGLSLILGLEWFDYYTNELGMTVGLILIGYSLLSLGFAYKVALWGGYDNGE